MSFRKGPTKSVSSSSSSSDAAPDSKRVFGVKPWLNCGLGLVSSGNRQLDEIIGGGIALGTVTMMSVDTFSNYGDTLVSYSIAESVGIGHETLLIATDELELSTRLESLPLNLNYSSTSTNNSSSGNNDSKGGDLNKDKQELQSKLSELTIAWQYGKYIENNASKKGQSKSISTAGAADPSSPSPANVPLVTQFCSSYDLSRSLQRELLESNPIITVLANNSCEKAVGNDVSDISDSNNDDADGLMNSLKHVMEAIDAALLRQQSSKSILRIFWPNVTDILSCWSATGHSDNNNVRLLFKWLLSVQQKLRTTRSTFTFSVKSSSTIPTVLRSLVTIADSVMGVESFVGRHGNVPAEFKEYGGFLYIHKLQQLGTIAPYRPSGRRFGLKRDRRKLHVEPLHMPPELSRTAASQGGGHPDAKKKIDSGLLENASSVGNAHSHDHSHANHSHSHGNSSASAVASATQDRVITNKTHPESNVVTNAETAAPTAPPKKLSLAERFGQRAGGAAGASGASISISRKPAQQPGSSCTPQQQSLLDF